MSLRGGGIALAVAMAVSTPARAQSDLSHLRPQVDAGQAREAIARVAYGEAAGQGDTGLAAVVFTILNRLQTRSWGGSVEAVLNAPRQFEPVLRAGGDWRGLPPASAAQRARIDTILNLALEGRLPDPTGGARYFQNPAIVADRARAGAVSPRLVHFGGATPSAVIGDHAFYVSTGRMAQAKTPPRDADAGSGGESGSDIFADRARAHAAASAGPAASAAGARGLFVLPDGQIVEDARGLAPSSRP